MVNNGAAARCWHCAALGDGEVVVSRGQLVEIGGSSVPEIVASPARAWWRSGTTNRTRLDDFHAAMDRPRAFLRVHPSNFKIVGFAEVADLADCARGREAGSGDGRPRLGRLDPAMFGWPTSRRCGIAGGRRGDHLLLGR